MGLLSKLFGKDSSIEVKLPEHALIVHFDYIGSTDLQPLFDLEQQLEAAIVGASAGEYDGNEVAVDGSDGFLYMYGPDADRLFAVVKPILESCTFMRGARIKLRYGPAEDGVREHRFVLGS
jgi:hypothetical protein